MEKHYILIDDDELVRMTWQFKAGAAGVSLRAFSSVEDFLKAKESVSKESLVYLDCDLGKGVRGEIVARDIFDEGFRNIYLATGEELKDLDFDKNIIKGVGGKAPPF